MIVTPARGVQALGRVRRGLCALPLQFWLLAAGSFVLLTAMGLAFPYVTIFICERLHVSIGTVGLIMGGSALAGLPLQVVAGHLSDRYGRRPILVVSIVATSVLYVGLAFAGELWQVVLLLLCERALGWPMFLASSNAMVADLVGLERRPEAYSVMRIGIMGGVVAGPALAGVALGAGVPMTRLFLVAGLACAACAVPLLVVLRETRPVEKPAAGSPEAAAGLEPAGSAAAGSPAAAASRGAVAHGSSGGYLAVLRDRRFLAFCAVALLPLFCLGQLYSTFPVVAMTDLGMPHSAWGVFIAMYALIVVTIQMPLTRLTKRRDPLVRLGVASACLGVGFGAAALAAPGWQLVVLLGVVAVGEVLLSPVSSTVVTGMAPVSLRGRYLGVWTLVWMFGLSLGPALGGPLMDAMGGRGLLALVLAVGLAGGAAFPLLQRRSGVRIALAFRRGKRG